MDEVAIRVEHVSKDFRLPHEKASSVKNLFVHAYSYLRKRHTYEVQHALHDVSFEVKKGEFFGIVGRNGSGKSTLLKMLAGIYQPNEGKIIINGKLVPFIELGVGFSPELTGKENVYLNGALLGFSKKEIDRQYKDIVDFAELQSFMDQKLKNYSSGMQVRLAFSMVIRAKADILLVDEVLAVGDAAFQRKSYEYFKTLKRQRKTVVFVSHDMSAVREFCDRAVLIEDSNILARGSTDMISQQYLKLFTDSQDQGPASAGKRWGDRAVVIESVEASAGTNSIVINEVLKVRTNIVNPIAGIRIRSSAGQEITGTNTKIEQQNLGRLRKGQTIKLQWRIPNVFSDGTYFVDPAVVCEDGVTVCDWWDEATSFIIKKMRRLPYNIDPGFQVEIS